MSRFREALNDPYLVPKASTLAVMFAGVVSVYTSFIDLGIDTLYGPGGLEGTLTVPDRLSTIIHFGEQPLQSAIAVIGISAGLATIFATGSTKQALKVASTAGLALFSATEVHELATSTTGISDANLAFWGGLTAITVPKAGIEANKLRRRLKAGAK